MMKNFSASITKAEQITGGNVNILKSLETPTKVKPLLNVSIASPGIDAGRKSLSASIASSSSSPTTPTAKKTITGSYNTSVKVQNTTNSEQTRSNDKRFTCTMCPFTTDRLNLLMMHIKGHASEIQSRVSCKLKTLLIHLLLFLNIIIIS